jgi:hypothetical protein
VIDPEGGAWSEGAAGVDVLVMSSSGGAQADAVNSHFVDAIFHRGEAVRPRVPGDVVDQLLYQHLQLVQLGVAGCKVARQWWLVSKVELD